MDYSHPPRARKKQIKTVNFSISLWWGVALFVSGFLVGFWLAPGKSSQQATKFDFGIDSTAVTQRTVVVSGMIEEIQDSFLTVVPFEGTEEEKQLNRLSLEIDDTASIYLQEIDEENVPAVTKIQIVDLQKGDEVSITISYESDGKSEVKTVSATR